ncbi:MAG: DUF4417 domain-containing protein [Eubacteriales bacterium]|nr:DUF4417 domain-containing protein [Eubacteriales bacterium]
MLNFENLDKCRFDGVGAYGIPRIRPVKRMEALEWIPFNYALSAKQTKLKGVHSFVDDYQLSRLWNQPARYVPILRRFTCVCSPDFSMYTDMPPAMQIYNHYRKHWLGAYWQSQGIAVVPIISWSDKSSFEWCFKGEPINSVVAVSSVGTQNSILAKSLFDAGYAEMIRRLEPSEVIFYGQVPEKSENVRHIEPYYQTIKVRRRKNNGR